MHDWSVANTINYSFPEQWKSICTTAQKKTYYLLFDEGGTQHGGTLASHMAFAFKFPLAAIDWRE